MKCLYSLSILKNQRESVRMKIDDIDNGFYSGKLSEDVISAVREKLINKLRDLNFAIVSLEEVD